MRIFANREGFSPSDIFAVVRHDNGQWVTYNSFDFITIEEGGCGWRDEYIDNLLEITDGTIVEVETMQEAWEIQAAANKLARDNDAAWQGSKW